MSAGATGGGGASRGGGPRTAVVGLGSNVGDRLDHLRRAARHLAALDAMRVTDASPVYETAPAGGPPQGPFLNAALRLVTALGPRALLERLLEVEAALGRVRRVRWGPRTIDLDLLAMEGVSVRERGLEVPHPRLLERAFALAPALDVWPEAPRDWRGRLHALGGPPGRRVVDDGSWLAALRHRPTRTESRAKR